MTDEALAVDARVSVEEFRKQMKPLLAGKKPFILRDENGAYEFPLWNKHQHHGPYRRRAEGGQDVGGNRALDKDKEEDEDKDKENRVPAPVAEIETEWNKLGPPFRQVAKMTTKRIRAARLRLADSWWKNHWRLALDRIKASPFCRGENNRHWIANLDFFLRPDTVAKTLEGAYDSPQEPGSETDRLPMASDIIRKHERKAEHD